MHELAGRAWSGHGPIVRVEVSDDDAATWSDADVDPPPAPSAWCSWRWTWHAEHPGRRVLAVRATDAAGHVQPIEQRWNRQAMANNHVQRVPVRRALNLAGAHPARAELPPGRRATVRP